MAYHDAGSTAEDYGYPGMDPSERWTPPPPIARHPNTEPQTRALTGGQVAAPVRAANISAAERYGQEYDRLYGQQAGAASTSAAERYGQEYDRLYGQQAPVATTAVEPDGRERIDFEATYQEATRRVNAAKSGPYTGQAPDKNIHEGLASVQYRRWEKRKAGMSEDEVDAELGKSTGNRAMDNNMARVEAARKKLRVDEEDSPVSSAAKYVAGKAIPVVSSVIQAIDLAKVYSASESFESADLTSSQVRALARFQNSAEDAENRGILASAGDMLLEMPAYAGEMALTGPFGGAAKTAARAGVTRMLGKMAASQLEKSMAKRALVKTVGGLADIAGRTIANPAALAAGTLERKIANPDESFAESAAHAAFQHGVGTGAELYTGKLLVAALPAGIRGKVVDAVEKNMLARWLAKDPGEGRTAKGGMALMMKSTGLDSLATEFAETDLENLINTAAGQLGAKGEEYKPPLNITDFSMGSFKGARGLANWAIEGEGDLSGIRKKVFAGESLTDDEKQSLAAAEDRKESAERFRRLLPQAISIGGWGVGAKGLNAVALRSGFGMDKAEKIRAYLDHSSSSALYEGAVKAGMPPIDPSTPNNRANRVAHGIQFEASMEAARLKEEADAEAMRKVNAKIKEAVEAEKAAAAIEENRVPDDESIAKSGEAFRSTVLDGEPPASGAATGGVAGDPVAGAPVVDQTPGVTAGTSTAAQPPGVVADAPAVDQAVQDVIQPATVPPGAVIDTPATVAPEGTGKAQATTEPAPALPAVATSGTVAAPTQALPLASVSVSNLPALKPDYVRVVHKGPIEAQESITKNGLSYEGDLSTTARSWADASQVQYESDDPRLAGMASYVFDVPVSEHRDHVTAGKMDGPLPAKYLVGVVPSASAKPARAATAQQATATPVVEPAAKASQTTAQAATVAPVATAVAQQPSVSTEQDAADLREWRASDEYKTAVAASTEASGLAKKVASEMDSWLDDNADRADDIQAPPMKSQRKLDLAVARQIKDSKGTVSESIERQLSPKKPKAKTKATTPVETTAETTATEKPVEKASTETVAEEAKKETEEPVKAEPKAEDKAKPEAEESAEAKAEKAKAEAAKPKPYSVKAMKEAFNLTDEQAEAIDEIIRRYGLDTNTIFVAKGGTPGKNSLYQIEDWVSGKKKYPEKTRDSGLHMSWLMKAIASITKTPIRGDLTEYLWMRNEKGKKVANLAGRKKILNKIYKDSKVELEAWTAVNADYRGFYDDSIEEANKHLQELSFERYGRRMTPNEIKFFHLVSAFGSPSAAPAVDSEAGVLVLDKFMQHRKIGDINALSHKLKTVWDTDANGKRFDTGKIYKDKDGKEKKSKLGRAYADDSLASFVHIANKLGSIDAAMDWISTKHSAAEMTEMMISQKRYKKDGTEAAPYKIGTSNSRRIVHEYLSLTEDSYGIFAIAGAKLGSYYLNRTGVHDTITKDLWYARTMARMLGQDLYPPVKKTKAKTEVNAEEGDVVEDGEEPEATNEMVKEPWSASTENGRLLRGIADEAWFKLAKELGIKPAIVQQRMWDLEKRFYEALGQPEGASTVSMGIEKSKDGLPLALRQESSKRTYKEIALDALNASAKAANDALESINDLFIPAKGQKVLFQGNKGSFEIDGINQIIRGLENPDVSTAFHEINHAMRVQLLNRTVPTSKRAGITDADIDTVEKWAGVKNGEWTVAAEEKLARALERHVRSGRSLASKVGDVLEKMSIWLKKIYRAIKGSPLDVKISPKVAEVFNKLLTRTERINKANPLMVEEGTDRFSVAINLSASTGSIPGLDALTQRAKSTDPNKADDALVAASLLQNIAADSLRFLTSEIPSAKVEFVRATGVYGNDREPALRLTVTAKLEDKEALLAAVAKFADNFNQDQIHVRGKITPGTEVGHEYGDGSFNTSVIRIKFKKRLTNKQVASLIKKSKAPGLTVTEDAVELYSTGDPKNAGETYQFEQVARRLSELSKGNNGESEEDVQRLFKYGNRAIPYSRIAGDVRTGDAEGNETSRRITAILTGKPFVAAIAPAKMTPEKKKLHLRITEHFGALQMNALDDPARGSVLMRAYSDLVKEIATQFDALPIKVEVWTKSDSQPYENSREMLLDVMKNNHLYLFKTDPKQFGPVGVTYEGHPLLEKTGRKDINGVELLNNDLLRIVHDYYAHSTSAASFGPIGEDVAWLNHMRMFVSPYARWALTSETRGQNSYVNFGPNAVHNKTNPKQTIYADQKVDLLPVEDVLTGDEELDAEFLEATKDDADKFSQPATEKDDAVSSKTASKTGATAVDTGSDQANELGGAVVEATARPAKPEVGGRGKPTTLQERIDALPTEEERDNAQKLMDTVKEYRQTLEDGNYTKKQRADFNRSISNANQKLIAYLESAEKKAARAKLGPVGQAIGELFDSIDASLASGLPINEKTIAAFRKLVKEIVKSGIRTFGEYQKKLKETINDDRIYGMIADLVKPEFDDAIIKYPPSRAAGYDPDKTTSVKKDKDAEERADRGLEPTKRYRPGETTEGWMAEARARVAEDPLLPETLIQTVITSPQTLGPVEFAILQDYHARNLADFDKYLNSRDRAKEAGDAFTEKAAEQELAIIAGRLEGLSQAAAISGSLWGKAGNALRIELRKDFSIDNLLRQARAAKGPLSEADRKTITEMAAKIKGLLEEQKAANAKLSAKEVELELEKAHSAAVEARNAELEAAVAAKAAKADAATAKPVAAGKPVATTATATAGKPAGDDAKAEGDAEKSPSERRASKATSERKAKVVAFKEIVGRAKKSGAIVTVAKIESSDAGRDDILKQVSDQAESVVEAYSSMRHKSFSDFMDQLAEDTDESIRDYEEQLREPWNSRQVKDITEALSKEIGEDTIGDVARDLHKFVIARDRLTGSKEDREKAVDAVHAILEEEDSLPGWTREDTADAMSGIGRYRLLSTDEVEVIFREQKAQLQQVVKRTRYWEKDQRPPPTGQQKTPDSPEQREERRLTNIAKRNANVAEVIDTDRQLSSAFDSAKTRMQNLIDDLKKAVDAVVPIERSKKAPNYSDAQKAEIAALQVKLDKARADYHDAFGKKGMTDDQRRAILVAAWSRQIEQLEKDIPAGVLYHTPDAKKPLTLTPEMEAKRAALDALLAARDELRQLSPETLAMAETAKEKDQNAEIARLEAEKAKGWPMPESKEKLSNAAIEANEKELAKLRSERLESRKLSPEWQARSDAAYARVLTSRLEFWANKILNKEFGPKPKVESRTLTKEQMDLQYKIESAKGEFVSAKERWAYEKRTLAQKMVTFIGNAWDFRRDIKSTGELSPIGRQGLLYTAGHWIGATKATVEALGVLFAKDHKNALSRINQQLMNRKNAVNGLYKNIPFADKLSNVTVQQEIIIGEWAKKFPLLGDLAKRFEDASKAFLNIIRANMMDSMVATHGWMANAATQAEIEVMGNAVGVLTGHGNVDPAVAKYLNKVLYSTVFTMSRIENLALRPLWRGEMAGTGKARVAIAKEYLQAAVGLYVLQEALMFAMSALSDDEDEVAMDNDITSSDFRKVKVGRTRLDTLGGEQQVAVLLARLATQTTTKDGVKKKLGSVFGSDNGLDVIVKWGRSRLHPTMGDIADRYVVGENVVGERPKEFKEYDPRTEAGAWNLVKENSPMAYGDMWTAIKELGYPRGLSAMALAGGGAGLSTFGDTKQEVSQSIALKAAGELASEDKLKSKEGATKGYTKSGFLTGGVTKARADRDAATGSEAKRLTEKAYDAAQDARDQILGSDVTVKSARTELRKRARTLKEAQDLYRAAYKAKYGKVGGEAYFKGLQRLNRAYQQGAY